MMMADTDLSDVSPPDSPSGLVDLTWTGAIDGLLQGVVSDQNIVALINVAFDQSPYIRSN